MNLVQLRLKGKEGVPLMMHSNQAVDPLNKYHLAMKPLSAKRNKTIDDLELLGRIEWEAGLYISPEDGFLCIPAVNIEKCFILAARKSKDGKKFEQGVYVLENYCRFVFNGGKTLQVKITEEVPNPGLDVLYKVEHIDRRPVCVQRNTLIRTRPIFHDWYVDCTVAYDENIIDEHVLLNCIEVAGNYIGLCEMRPRFGRFDVEVLDKG